MKEEYFDPEFRPVVKLIHEYRRKTNQLPSLLTVRSKTGVQLEAPEDANTDGVVGIVCEDAEAFIRERAMDKMLIESAELLAKDKSRGTMLGLHKKFQEIARLTVKRELGLEVFRDMHKVLSENKDNDLIPTGMDILDRCLDGGVSMPSLNLVSASSGHGKSIWLQNMAVNMATLFGVNVVFYTLELEPKTIFKRFAAMLTETAMGRVYSDLDQVVFKTKKLASTSGQIRVFKFPMVGTTVGDIAAHYNDLIMETGEEFPIVCVDYIDVMTPMRPGIRQDDIHLRDKAISEELNDFAHEPGVYKIVWSASQQVKGAESEKESEAGSVSGGKDKVSTCDNLIILKRSKDDQMEERGWGFIKKARDSGGKDMRFPFKWNAETQRMTSWPDEDLFLEANPIMRRRTGKRDATKIEKDPIGKEQGVVAPPKEKPDPGQKKVGRDIQEKVLGIISKRQQ